MINIKNVIFLAVFLIICLTNIQPVLAEQSYKIEFEAVANGVFFVFRGVQGIHAVGVGECRLGGSAVVTQLMSIQLPMPTTVYYDFPAEMDLSGELTGKIRPVYPNSSISEEEWSIELEFWNLKKAGGAFASYIATDDMFLIQRLLPEPSPGPKAKPKTCLGYKLVLEKENDDECELKIQNGKAYGIVAGLFPTNGETWVFVAITLRFDGEPFTVIFGIAPSVEPPPDWPEGWPTVPAAIDVEVKLD